MNYGLYLSASGVLTNMYRQDVFANNLANVETIGFKADLADVRQRDPASIETPMSGEVSRRLLDQLGGGVLAAPQRINFARGPMQETGRNLDIALEDAKSFLVVQPANAAASGASAGKAAATKDAGIRLTRDGRLTRDAQGYLVTAAGGHRILDTQDQPIQLSSAGQVQIDERGHVSQDGQNVAQIQVASVTDAAQLRKAGQNLFRFDGNKDLRKSDPTPSIKPGFVEGSGVDPILALMDVVGATKSVEAAANMIRYQDQLMDRAVNTLARVA